MVLSGLRGQPWPHKASTELEPINPVALITGTQGWIQWLGDPWERCCRAQGSGRCPGWVRGSWHSSEDVPKPERSRWGLTTL